MNKGTALQSDCENKMESRKCAKLNNLEASPKTSLVKLRNIADNELVFTDTIHQKTLENIACGSKCKGSLMGTLTKQKPKLKEEILTEAEDFFQQYFSSFKRKDSAQHTRRWLEVKTSIEDTGTYHMTTEELQFGAKTGWRNAPRCIGRIQWSNLQLFDARDVTDASGMFEVICRHMKYATNGGKLRSAITVFRQRNDNDHDFRIWNTQLIMYAGYRQADGIIIGDPMNAHFTEICMKMGWKGKFGMFDILPLVMQANGGDPEWFEYPNELVLEAEITHPRYPGIKELGIRWYCLPAVANMMLDCGGLQFTACPFSGWYMGTEVGARDLCDKHRYNMLEKIAGAIGLDTKSNASLWRDKAVVEINIAVIHSFRAVGATIVDHHSASESFMNFMQNEYRQRGGCPADWVWIVPPISGSLMSVFHQEMLLFKLKPSYEYQDEAWRTYVWRKDQYVRQPKPRRKLSFKILSSVIYQWFSLMKQSMAQRVKCTILYATETGKSEMFANTLHKMFRQNFNVRVLIMDHYNIKELKHEEFILFVTSTFGNGDPPENGKTFAHALTTIKELPGRLIGKYDNDNHSRFSSRQSNRYLPQSLGHIKFSVFGLGSRAYPKFCAFSQLIDKTIESLGATRIYSLGEGDELCGQEESFRHWAKKVYQVACSFFNIGGKHGIYNVSEVLERADTSWSQGKYRLVEAVNTQVPSHEELSRLFRKQVFPCKLKDRKRLSLRGSSHQTILAKIDIRRFAELLQFSPGDHVLLYPENTKKQVQQLIASLKDVPSENTPITIERRTQCHGSTAVISEWKVYNRLPIDTLEEILSKYLDIATPPTQDFLNVLSNLAETSEDKFKIKRLVNNSRAYNDWKSHGMPNICEVIRMFPSLHVSPAFLLTQLPLLQPRYYSISSSLHACPGEIHVTAEVVEYQTPDGTKHKGVCSNWLNELPLGETVMCSVRRAPLFHLPKFQSVPILMVGPGTGIAPFRGFWMQRKYDTKCLSSTRDLLRENFGEMILYFGCRNATSDNIFREELMLCQKDQILTKCFFAFSREPGIKKTYVQDLISKNGRDVYKKLIKENGHLYICGNVQMASDVKLSLRNLIMSFGRKSQKQADDYIDKMKEENRLHEDIFGVAVKKQNKKDPKHFKRE